MKNSENEIGSFSFAIERQHTSLVVGQTVPEISIVMPTYNVFYNILKSAKYDIMMSKSCIDNTILSKSIRKLMFASLE